MAEVLEELIAETTLLDLHEDDDADFAFPVHRTADLSAGALLDTVWEPVCDVSNLKWMALSLCLRLVGLSESQGQP